MRLSSLTCSGLILLFCAGCGGGSSGPSTNSSGGSMAGSSGGSSNPGSGGADTAGSGGTGPGSGGTVGETGGSTSGGGPGTDTGGADPGSGGQPGSGGSGPGGKPADSCPAGATTGTPVLTGKTLTKIDGVPEIVNNGGFLEGPVWYDGKLYVSQVDFAGPPPSSVIFTYTPGGSFTPFIMDAGSIGLAVDASGHLFAASPKSQGVIRYDAADSSAAAVDVATMFADKPFNSPNDIVVRSDGTVYFTDPPANCGGSCAQPDVQGVYSVTPGGTIALLPGVNGKPNGIALSPDEQTLYIGGDFLTAYPLMADGSVGAGTKIDGIMGTDGLTVDCAGNVYAALYSQSKIVAVDASGALIAGEIASQEVTNLAFGGPDMKTLYVTSFGDNRGVLSSVVMEVPGYSY